MLPINVRAVGGVDIIVRLLSHVLTQIEIAIVCQAGRDGAVDSVLAIDEVVAVSVVRIPALWVRWWNRLSWRWRGRRC
jgi:hypothetical protein